MTKQGLCTGGREWQRIGVLKQDFSKYNKDIGVYRALLNDEVVYVGKATELDNGGFRKRLRDYTRESDSARNYPAGEKMYEHRDDIQIEIIVFDRNPRSIPEIEACEKSLIKELNPKWNEHEK
jgi:excinuclease UvrABC nuclease subunit